MASIMLRASSQAIATNLSRLRCSIALHDLPLHKPAAPFSFSDPFIWVNP
jgi:hypothetical protein